MTNTKHTDLNGRIDSDLLHDTLSQGLSRREALKALTAAGFFAVGGSSLLLGPSARAAASQPRQGGKIRVALQSSSTSDTLDPAKGQQAIDYCRDFTFYDGLTTFDEHLVPQPSLAEKFESPDRGKTWLFDLRSGVTFHNGKSLSPADVIYTINRQKDPLTGSKILPLVKQIESVKASKENQVKIVLKSPDIDFPAIMATSHMLIVPDGTTDFSKGIGTGPFECKEFIPGVRSVAVRNKNYWKSGKPYLDSIEMVGIGNTSSRVNALLSDDVQMINELDHQSTERVKDNPGTAVDIAKSGNYTDLVMRLDMQPGTRPAFVEGMKYLFDRKRIRDVIFNGYAEIANDQPIAASNPYYFDGLPQRQYDPDRARALFKKAGVTGARLPVVASHAARGSIKMASLLQQAAVPAGLEIKIDRMPAAGYWSDYWAKKPVTYGNINPRPTANILLSMFFMSGAPWNESRWNNPKFDQLVVASRSEPDKSKRMQMYADMQTLIHNESGIGIPVFIDDIGGYSSKIGGMDRKIPIGGLMGHRFAQYIWLKQ